MQIHELSFASLLLTVTLCACGCSTSSGGMSAADQRAWSDAHMKNGAGPLDGRSFQVELVEKGKSSGAPDTLEFAGGRFHSTACDQYGFGSGSYQARMDGDAVAFTAVCTNEKHEKNEWHATVKGNAIEGSLVCAQGGSDQMEFVFKGKAVQR